MERRHTMILAVGFAVALPIIIGPLINSATADGRIASNIQLRGQYTGTPTGGCLISLDGFDQNNRPVNSTRTYQQPVEFRCRIHLSWQWHGDCDLKYQDPMRRRPYLHPEWACQRVAATLCIPLGQKIRLPSP